jgi:hypothetical protein
MYDEAPPQYVLKFFQYFHELLNFQEVDFREIGIQENFIVFIIGNESSHRIPRM